MIRCRKAYIIWPQLVSLSKTTKLILLDSLLQEVCISSGFDWSLTLSSLGLSVCLSQSQTCLFRAKESPLYSQIIQQESKACACPLGPAQILSLTVSQCASMHAQCPLCFYIVGTQSSRRVRACPNNTLPYLPDRPHRFLLQGWELSRKDGFPATLLRVERHSCRGLYLKWLPTFNFPFTHPFPPTHFFSRCPPPLPSPLCTAPSPLYPFLPLPLSPFK